MKILPFDSSDVAKATVLVVGDVMLDRYWQGSTTRISPEAPVPIVRVNEVVERPGGAANVALGIAALGAKVHLLGLVGQDEAANHLQKLLNHHNIHNNLISLFDVSTIIKLRILSHNQQMIRLDNEPTVADMINSTGQSLLQTKFDELLASGEIKAIAFSDYGKGTLHHIQWMIQKAKSYNIPVLVDPKSNDFSIYRGSTLITPNLKEFEAVVGKTHTESDILLKGQALITEQDIQALIITRSEQGMSVIRKGEEVVHLKALARQVHDVTGAGDTVSAVLSIALAIDMDWVQAAALGNKAASIVVGKLGTATVTLEELKQALDLEQPLPLGVLTEEELILAVQLSKARGERIVFTNGCFDILHVGHIKYLEQAKALGDRVIVAVNTDASVAKLKGPKRPIHSVTNRMSVLAGLKSVDWIVPFGEDTPERLIKRLSPHILVKGGDYTRVEDIAGSAYVLSQGGQVHLLDFQEGYSTTRTIEALLA